MCYYNGMRVTKSEFLRLLEVEKDLEGFKEVLWRPAQSGFVYRDWPILLPQGKHDLSLHMAEWGFLPGKMKSRAAIAEFRSTILTLNAKVENLFVNERGKPSMFKGAAMNGRCLVLSSGFYEWRHLPKIGKKGTPLSSTEGWPYYIYLPGQEYFYMLGVQQDCYIEDIGESIKTFTIVTTEGNPLMAEIHNKKKRMPVIATEEVAHAWLYGDLTESDVSAIGAYQYDFHQMGAYTVAKDFMAEPEPWQHVEQPIPPIKSTSELDALQEKK